MYDPATRTGIVCVNGRCITNTPSGKNSVIQEERLGTMRPGPKPQPAGPRMIDQNGNVREHPHHRHGQASNDIPLLENMWTDGMITKEDVSEPGQKAIDFSGGLPKNPQSGQQFNNKKEMQNTMHRAASNEEPRMTNIDMSQKNSIEYTDIPMPQNTGPKIFQGNPTD